MIVVVVVDDVDDDSIVVAAAVGGAGEDSGHPVVAAAVSFALLWSHPSSSTRDLPRLFPFAVPSALHDDLPGVDRGRLAQTGAPGAEAHHPDAPPVPHPHGGRVLHSGKEYDSQGEMTA